MRDEKELRAAAERAKTNVWGTGGYIADNKLGDLMTEAGQVVFDAMLADARSLADAYLADHPEDGFLAGHDTAKDSPLRDADPILWHAVTAAELIQAVPYDEWFGKNTFTEWQLKQAFRAMAKLIARDHPADDAEPVTAERLTGIGFTGDEWRLATGHASDKGPHLCFGFAPMPGDECPRAWIQYRHPLKYGNGEVANVPIPFPENIAAVRRSCYSLGIVLTEAVT